MRVAINGFGRIGRMVFRAIYERAPKKVTVVAINDLTDTKTLAHLLKYDSVHGMFKGIVDYDKDSLIVNKRKIRVFAERDPANLPWKKNKIDVVIESTGFFTTHEKASKHLVAGAKKVLISAPAGDADITIVKGVNDYKYDKKKHHIISNASCTTNCISPVLKVINDKFGIVKGYLNTVHADTNDQHLVDVPHSDLRRARAAGTSIIPTTTGAAKAVALVIPELKGKLDGIAMRVPIMDGSISDLVLQLKKNVTAKDINKALKNASNTKAMKEVLSYTEEPIVSVDIIGNPHSSIVDGLSTMANKDLIKVIVWYDNEWGYSCRMVDVAQML